MSLTRQERGWGGHFIGAANCRFRRNTLVSDGERHVVISTVGGYCPSSDPRGAPQTIGIARHYETMAFVGHQEGAYIEADVGRQVHLVDEDWSIEMAHPLSSPLNADVDIRADAMHEANVLWVMRHFEDCFRTAEVAA